MDLMDVNACALYQRSNDQTEEELEEFDEEVFAGYDWFGCIGHGCSRISRRPRRPSLPGSSGPPWSPRFMTGAASTSAATAAGARAAIVGISMGLLEPSSLTVAASGPEASLVARSVIAGRPAPGCSVWKARAIGPISPARVSAFSFQSKPAQKLMASAFSPARSVGLGTRRYSM